MKINRITLAAILLFSFDAYAIRCGSQLVQIDDLKLEVLDKCGGPLAAEDIGYVDKIKYYDRITILKIEEWIYHINGRYVSLVFHGNQLKEIRRNR